MTVPSLAEKTFPYSWPVLIAFWLVTPFHIVLSQLQWIQTDWSGGRFESIVNAEARSSPGELLLKTLPAHMVHAFSPTQLEGIWDMEVLNGKLYLAACTNPLMVNGGDVIAYDYATDTWSLEYSVWEQGVIRLVAHNGKLYVPGADSQGSWRWGNIYIYDGTSWVRKGTVPNGIHVFDLIFYRGEMFVTTGTNVDNWSGKLYKSTDEGDSWTEAFRVEAEDGKQENFRRLYFMGIFRDTLYIQSDLRPPEGKVVFRYSDGGIDAMSNPRLSGGYGMFLAYNAMLYFLDRQYLHRYNGSAWKSFPVPFSGNFMTRSMIEYGGFLYAGAHQGTLYRTADGTLWQKVSQTIPRDEEIEALASYHGRLYASTVKSNGHGSVYVSAAVPRGHLVSEKYDFGVPVRGAVIDWDALNPSPSTAISFQVRTANTSDELDSLPFTGPDGTAASYYTAPGTPLHFQHEAHRWIQYKVYLATTDSAYTPVLQEVRITTTTSSVNKPIARSTALRVNLYQNFPNPVGMNSPSGQVWTTAAFEIHGHAADVSLELHDMLGRTVRSLWNGPVFPGPHVLRINTGDLSSGMYLIRLTTQNATASAVINVLN